jgi:hypothetical protein
LIHRQAVSHSEVIYTPASTVWALLVDWSGIINWMPGGYIQELQVEGEGVGAIRHLITGRGVAISERLDDMDEKSGSLQLTIIEPLPWGMLSYTAQAQLEDVNGDSCRLSWCGTFELPESGPAVDELAALLKKSYSMMFKGIRTEVIRMTGRKNNE